MFDNIVSSGVVAKGHRLTPRQRILVIANPTAGSRFRRRLTPIVQQLGKWGCSVDIHETKARGDAEQFVASNDGGDFDVIAAAGGDGTINEVLNGLPEKSPPLAILPLGTVNVLAEEVAIPRSVLGIAETVAFGRSRLINIGEANGRRFVMMASVGFDAEVVEHVDLKLKCYVGKWAYLYESLKRFLVSQPSTYRLRIDDNEQVASGVIIANGHYYAGRYVTSPGANLEKPALDICSLTRSGRLALPQYAMSLMRNRLAERCDVRIDEATELEILGPPGAPLQADGDVLCRLPATIRIVPKAVNLICPATA